MSVTSFANIFSHSVDCLFVLLILPLLFKSFTDKQKLKELSTIIPALQEMLKERLFFLSFVFCLFVVVVAISWAAPTAYGGSQARG